MKIVFDANAAVKPNRTGVGMYQTRLIQAMSEARAKDVFIGYFQGFEKAENAKNITYKKNILLPTKITNQLRRWHIQLPVEIFSRTKADLVLYPNFLMLPSLFGTKSIVVVHDLTFKNFPEFLAEKNKKDLQKFVPRSVREAHGVIAVSEYVKSQLCSEFDIAAEKVLVTPIPPEEKLKLSAHESKQIVRKFGAYKPFILYLGTLEPRKNLIALLKAYENCAELHSKYDLVLAGGMDWKFEEIKLKIEAMQKNGLSVIHCGYVSPQERAALYQEASLFTLPSHEEGFGMPILEAMQYGTPAAISNIPVFHEVAGNLATYFNQNDPDDIAEKIKHALSVKSSSKQKQSLIKHSQQTNWENIAKSVLDFISKV